MRPGRPFAYLARAMAVDAAAETGSVQTAEPRKTRALTDIDRPSDFY
jgi:hypothetical protein